MLSKQAIIEMGDYCLSSHQFNKRRILSNHYNLNSGNGFLVDIKNKKLKIVLEGELINIRFITLPNVSRKDLPRLIKDELTCYYNASDNIAYDYIIVNTDKNSIDTAVFTIDNSKINYIYEEARNKVKIHGVYLIQLCFLNYYKDSIKEKNYIFTFIYHDTLYLLYCMDNVIRHNYIYKNFQEFHSLKTILQSFIDSVNISNDNIIYFANYGSNDSDLSSIGKYKCIYLGDIDTHSFLNFIKEKR
ncbi:hypothetical protein HMPREF1982_03277 [Clostridiales bacterium oral taxon 876 str. F0540]|nr:hypothetical protein HMPREF1982_03277 [Clostridiales bacterium oral taxon 876 str. F0540]